MRITVTLDDDLHTLLEQRSRLQCRPVREVANDALREVLGSRQVPELYRVEVQHARLLPGVDPDRLNQLADEFEDHASLARMGR